MNPKIFIDTNIFIYAYSDTEIEKRNKAREILNLQNISISTQVINEFIWIMNRKYKIDMNLLKAIIKNIFNEYEVQIIDENIIYSAIDMSGKYGYTYWDSLMLSVALNNNCEILYSEDMHNQQIVQNNLTIINPFLK